MVPVFRAGSLDCRLLDTSILSLNLSSPSALLIVKVYTLLVDPTNRRRRRRSFVIADRVSSSTERVSRTQTVSEFTHEFPLKINFHQNEFSPQIPPNLTFSKFPSSSLSSIPCTGKQSGAIHPPPPNGFPVPAPQFLCY